MAQKKHGTGKGMGAEMAEKNQGEYGNYMDCLAPNDRSATGLKGVDQDAMQARMRMKGRSESMHAQGPAAPYDWGASQRDYRAVEPMEKRNNRGGATFRKDDTLCQY